MGSRLLALVDEASCLRLSVCAALKVLPAFAISSMSCGEASAPVMAPRREVATRSRWSKASSVAASCGRGMAPRQCQQFSACRWKPSPSKTQPMAFQFVAPPLGTKW